MIVSHHACVDILAMEKIGYNPSENPTQDRNWKEKQSKQGSDESDRHALNVASFLVRESDFVGAGLTPD